MKQDETIYETPSRIKNCDAWVSKSLGASQVATSHSGDCVGIFFMSPDDISADFFDEQPLFRVYKDVWSLSIHFVTVRSPVMFTFCCFRSTASCNFDQSRHVAGAVVLKAQLHCVKLQVPQMLCAIPTPTLSDIQIYDDIRSYARAWRERWSVGCVFNATCSFFSVHQCCVIDKTEGVGKAQCIRIPFDHFLNVFLAFKRFKTFHTPFIFPLPDPWTLREEGKLRSTTGNSSKSFQLFSLSGGLYIWLFVSYELSDTFGLR